MIGLLTIINKRSNTNGAIRVKPMITTIVQFTVSEPIKLEEAKKIFSGTAPKYVKIQGLIRKYYLLSKEGDTAGGVYLWESQEDAEKFYTQDWQQFILEKYGSNPIFTFFNSPVIVDNLSEQLICAD